ncbi:type I methionyl aminopeptidase [Haliangium ochraceum]|uniref:Methionine aminopeptidase n=1 Tax=Haliangium ochraceum (strain DSM 14365 / JCM 11303 / SMP-2) TaxID=502025 RepID=D0LMF6_HALO1|nr:type I methionyl aminopeptidase [Haliangium ochraceum]ACY16862.1 methionine aminopeptidase, type I [Haliangium ochraceum DSM 14365]
MAVRLKSKSEIATMRKVGLAVVDVLDAVHEACRPGTTTAALNQIAYEVMTRAGGVSSFLGYAPGGAPPYPAVLCTSINHEIVHGIPSQQVRLAEGDLIGIDFACHIDGFCADSARTVGVGSIAPAAQELLDVARDALDHAIALCTPGKRLGDLGWAVQSHAESNGYSVVRHFCGHGIGRRMHEDPQVPNYGRAGHGRRLKRGMVLAIEPMLNVGSAALEVLEDGWTVVTRDGELSAHFEHSVAITDDGPLVLTRR